MTEIYALFDPREGDVRYIGKANDAHERLKTHLRDARRRKTPVYSWIRKLVDAGVNPGVRILAHCQQAEWPELERRLIAEYRLQGARLLNLADGGDEPFCSTEQRRANAVALNARRAADPFAFATHSFMRYLGQMRRHMGDDKRAVGLERLIARCRAMDPDWLAFQLSERPRCIRFFPKECHDSLRALHV